MLREFVEQKHYKFAAEAPDKATDGGVLDVRRRTLTQSDVKKQRLERMSPCTLMVQ